MDVDDGYVLWTGIWKGMYCIQHRGSHGPSLLSLPAALGNSKGPYLFIARFLSSALTYIPPADIVKMVESQPDLANQIRRVRGGYLKIQGTWMPYEVCQRPFCSWLTRQPVSPR
jgi:hypothetical protein